MPKGYKHGLRYTPEYTIWLNMKQRCSNPNKWDYPYYGGRGLTVCDRWLESVVNFVEDMGRRPSKNHQLDRIDNDKGYSLDNCRWVEKEPQMRNTRLSKRWFVNHIEYPSIAAAAKANNVSISTIQKWCYGVTQGKYQYPAKEGCWSENRYA